VTINSVVDVIAFGVVDLTVFEDVVDVAHVSMQLDFVKNLFPFPAHPPYMKLIQLKESLSKANIEI